MQLTHDIYCEKTTTSKYSSISKVACFLTSSLLIILLPFVSFAQETQEPEAFSALAGSPGSQGARYVSTRLIIDRSAVEPEMPASDQGIRVGVLFSIKKHWHIYWRNSGEAALPTKVSFSVPEGWEVSSLQWPMPNRYIERGDITTYGYSDEVLLYAYIRPPDEVLDAPEEVKIGAELSYLVCNDICVPGRDRHEISIPYSGDTAISPSESFDVFERYSRLVPQKAGADSNPGIVPLVSHETIAPGESGSLFLTIRHSGKNTISASSVQLFPHQSDGITFAPPRLLPQGPTETRISLPFVADQDISAKSVVLSGVIAFAPEAIASEHPLGVTWSASFAVAESSIPNTEASGLISTDGKILAYRTSHYADEKSADNKKTIRLQDDASKISIAYALICAFIGGIILNLMPCVLPIISIKVMGFIGGAEQPRAHSLRAALSFSLGVVMSFMLLAALVVALRSSGVSAGWGFQFQHPEFVYVLTLIVFVLGLGFFDVYSLNLPGMQSANRGVSSIRSPMLKHFFDGVLATALSTPCTAPFLGTALVFAFSQPAWITFLIFFVMGLGLALPYAYLSTHPKMLSMLPTPGPWMYRFRQLMGFLLLGTVVWLVFVLQQLTAEGAIWTLATMLLLFFGSWLLSWISEGRKSTKRNIAQIAAAVFVCAGVAYLYPSAIGQSTSEVKINWRAYSEELVQDLQSEGNIVFVDFTADWCITCKANEFLTIETEQVISAMKRLNVVPVKADWTRGDPQITEALQSYGAEGVPFYVVLPGEAGGEAIIPSTIPTASELIAAFERAKSNH